MASGLGVIFDNQAQQGPRMAAPGVPMGALSGNVNATLTNISTIAGAQAGSNLGAAIGGALGAQPVNPAQMMQQRQQEFAAGVQQVMADGKVMQGDAIRSVADAMFKGGRLPGNEYLAAIGEATKQQETDRKFLGEAVSFVNKNKLVDEYRMARTTHDQLLETAKDTPSGANDFLLIQQGLKILDPTSIVSKSEIAQGRLSAVGAQELSALGFNINQIINFAAYGGKKPLLSDTMKERWLSTISRKVDAQRGAATEIYSSAAQQYQAGGGALEKFRQATGSTAALLSGPDQAILTKNAAGDFTDGGMRDTLFGRLDLAKGAVTDMLSATNPGGSGQKIGPSWLGVEVKEGTPADWMLRNLGISPAAGAASDPSSAALAVTPLAAQKQLKETHGETGPLGMAIDTLTGYPALGPLNDAVIHGINRTPAKRKKKDKRPILPIEPPGQAKMPRSGGGF